ncbi:hypothetical protein Tco_0327632 [Tanacetum coccineum]
MTLRTTHLSSTNRTGAPHGDELGLIKPFLSGRWKAWQVLGKYFGKIFDDRYILQLLLLRLVSSLLDGNMCQKDVRQYLAADTSGLVHEMMFKSVPALYYLTSVSHEKMYDFAPKRIRTILP